MKMPVCVECQVSYHCVEVGAVLVETYLDGQQAYKTWPCDVYECRGCGNRILTGFSNKPSAVAHDGDKIEVEVGRGRKIGKLYFEHERVKGGVA